MMFGEQFSYRSDLAWRPQAQIIQDESLSFLGACFSWGEIDLSNRVFENVRFFIDAMVNNSEITNPFGFNDSLSSLENALRSGCSLANDIIYRIVNKSTLTAGVECFLAVKRGEEVALLQVGQPQIFLLRNKIVHPLFTSNDSLLVSDVESDRGAFLPNVLLGVTTNCYPQIRSFRWLHGDELIVLAHSYSPMSIFKMASTLESEQSFKELFQKISKEYPRAPFWLSRLKI